MSSFRCRNELISLSAFVPAPPRTLAQDGTLSKV
jgi:hypothetical protein